MKFMRLLFTYIILFLISTNLNAQKNDDVNNLLLKNYRPVSIYNIPVTEVHKARFPVIDMHSHPYAETREDLDQWVKNMDDVGIEKTIVLTQAHGAAFDSLVDFFSPYEHRFELWCGFDYKGYDKPGFGPDAVAELERCYRKGAKGVGELGDKGKGLFYCEPEAFGMHADDPRMDPLFEKCAELNLPVNIHVAEPKWMYEKMDSTNDGLMNAYNWRLDNKPDIVGHNGMIDILEQTVKRHPNTTFIACHYANCSYDLSKIAALLDQYPNLHLDISARYAEVSAIPRHTREFIEKYQDRLVYGTDMSYNIDMYRFTLRILESKDEHIYSRYNTYHWPLHGLGLSDEVLKKLYRDNALKIIQLIDEQSNPNK